MREWSTNNDNYIILEGWPILHIRELFRFSWNPQQGRLFLRTTAVNMGGQRGGQDLASFSHIVLETRPDGKRRGESEGWSSSLPRNRLHNHTRLKRVEA